MGKSNEKEYYDDMKDAWNMEPEGEAELNEDGSVSIPGPFHIEPINDRHDHITLGTACWCRPSVGEDGVITHHSADGREWDEWWMENIRAKTEPQPDGEMPNEPTGDA